MKKIYKNLFTLFLISFVLFSFSCKKDKEIKEASSDSMLIIQTVLGDVKVQSGGEAIVPEPGTSIKENSTIITGRLSLVDLKYKNSGVIRINENSNVNIAKLFSSENADETILQMDKGKVFVTVSKLMKDSKFEVKTPTSVAGIRGTSFRVSAEDGISRVDVLAGRVKVNPVKDDKVVESIEKIVEPDKAVEIDQKDIIKIVEEKKEIEVVALQKKEIEIIKEEAKLIKIDNTFNQELQTEIKEIGIESKPAEQIKDNKEYEQELLKQLQKANEEKEAALKEHEAAKARDEAETKERELKEKQVIEKEAKTREEKSRKEKTRLEQIEKDKKQAEELARQKEIERQEKIKEEKRKEKQKEEERVKNIPNF